METWSKTLIVVVADVLPGFRIESSAYLKLMTTFKWNPPSVPVFMRQTVQMLRHTKWLTFNMEGVVFHAELLSAQMVFGSHVISLP